MRSLKLSHSLLSNLINEYKPIEGFSGGICFGFTWMWAQALLANDLPTYNKRLNYIDQNYFLLKQKLKKYPGKISGLSAEEIEAYFQGIVLYQEREEQTQLLDPSIVNIGPQEIFSLTKPAVLQDKQLAILLNQYVAFDKNSLFNYLRDLQQLLNPNLPIILSAENHTVGIQSNLDGSWHYMDVENLGKKNDFTAIDTKQLVDCIYKSFATQEIAIFNTTVAGIDLPAEALEKFGKFNQKYQITNKEANFLTKNKSSLLFLACQTNQIDLLQKLLSLNPVCINQALVKEKATPLYIACQNGHDAIVQLLLVYPKIEINKKCLNQSTALYVACAKNKLACVQLLMQHSSIDINVADCNGATPLYIACQEGHIDVVLTLLAEQNIDYNRACYDGATPLYIACQYGHLAVVEALLAQPGIKLNQIYQEDKTNELQVACENGHFAIVKLLIENKLVDLNHTNCDDQSAIDIAKKHGHINIANYLANPAEHSAPAPASSIGLRSQNLYEEQKMEEEEEKFNYNINATQLLYSPSELQDASISLMQKIVSKPSRLDFLGKRTNVNLKNPFPNKRLKDLGENSQESAQENSQEFPNPNPNPG